MTVDRSGTTIGIPSALAVAQGSSIRGVAGGLEADTYDWETSNNSARQGTLQYLRDSRDYDATLFITANIRGIVGPDPSTPGNQIYTDESIPTLANLAADWVRYTNHIVQTYRQGDTITDPTDLAVLNAITWNAGTTGAPASWFDKLLAPGEAAVPKVEYWEIGNEPRVQLVTSYKVTNGYTFLAPPSQPDATHKTDYAQRYAAEALAMKAQDPTIKVGPALQYLSSSSEQALLKTILEPQTDGSLLPVDFISYHPYQTLNTDTTVATLEAGLRGVYDDHLAKVTLIRNQITADGRDPNSIPLVASEQNVSNYTSNDTVIEAQMSQALGNTETVFSFARLGIQDAHYWVYPANPGDGTKYPMYLADEKLRDFMGDTILSVSAADTDNLHLYTTRDSKTHETALWGLNFDNDNDTTRSTPITNVGGRGKVTLYVLGALSGKTTLYSTNLASGMAGGPTHDVDWTTIDLTGQRLDNLSLTFKAATITLLTIDPWRQMSLPGDVNADGKVDSTDVSLVNSSLNQNEKNWWQGDVNGDGVVNAADAAIVSANSGAVLGTAWKVQGGSWTATGSWTGGVVPNATGATAYLGSSITGAASVTASGAITLGSLAIDNVNPYTVSGSGSLKMLVSGSLAAHVYVIEGSQKISVPLTIASSTGIDLAANTSLSIGNLAISAGKTMTLTGSGTLAINGTQTHASGAVFTANGGTTNFNSNAGGSSSALLTVNANAAVNFNAAQNLAALNVGAGGRATINGGSLGALKTSALSITGSGKVDVAAGRMIVDYTGASVLGSWNGSAYSGVAGMVASGHLLTSALAVSGAPTTVAIAEAADILHLSGSTVASWGGQVVDATSVLVRYTYAGDANLSGNVDGDDYFRIDSGFAAHASGYYNGDFNYDGKVDADDYFIIDHAYAEQGTALAAELPMGASVVAVPEPVCWALLPMAMCFSLRRCR